MTGSLSSAFLSVWVTRVWFTIRRTLFQTFVSITGPLLWRDMFGSRIGIRAYKFLYRRLKTPSGKILVRYQGMKLYVDMGDTAVGQLIIWQEYERRECEVFHNIVRKGMTVVDAGANIGLYTIIASKLVGPTGRVFAFEPEPHNFRLLTTNLRLNTCSNVTAINAGLSDSDGSVDLFLDAENFGLHSFSQRNVSNPAGSIRVRTTTLDSSLGDTKIEILKMDVQGWEASVLRGAKHFLDRRGAAILMELWPFGLITHGENPPKLLDMLIDRGFSPTILETYPAQERTNGSDLLYEFTKRQSEDSYLNILFVKE